MPIQTSPPTATAPDDRASAAQRLAGQFQEQEGMVTRVQARELGLTEEAIRHRLGVGDWRQVRRGVYATFTGGLNHRQAVIAAQLWAGEGAVLSHTTAAELWGLTDKESMPIHVTVPNERSRKHGPDVVVHRSRRLAEITHPTAVPPRTRIEHTIVALTQVAPDIEKAIGWLTRGVNSRRTTPEKLFDVINAWPPTPGMRWRSELGESLGFVEEGCESILELGYFTGVEQAHGLPTGERQFKWGRVYFDVLYRAFSTVVELDGRAYHPFDQRFRDMARDNAVVQAHGVPLRYGPAAIFDDPCRVAVQVGGVLLDRGWLAGPIPCTRPTCAVRQRV